MSLLWKDLAHQKEYLNLYKFLFIFDIDPWAEFSTLDTGMIVYHEYLFITAKLSNLKLKIQPKQLFGYIPLASAFPHKNLIIKKVFISTDKNIRGQERGGVPYESNHVFLQGAQ